MRNEQLNILALQHICGLQLVTGVDVPQPHIGADGPQEAWVNAEGRQVYCKWCGDMPDLVNDDRHLTTIRRRMGELGFWCELTVDPTGMNIVKFYDRQGRHGWHDVATFDLEPLATVMAALKALGVLTAGGELA